LPQIGRVTPGVFALLASSWIAAADSPNPPQVPPPAATPRAETIAQQLTHWLDGFWNLSLFSFLAPPDSPPAASPAPEPMPAFFSIPLLSSAPPPPCPIEPLAEITDPKALAFEETSHNGSRVDLSGLTLGARRGLARFEKTVDSVGGEMILTSVYRPPAYQQHLEDVWDKWQALRDNAAPECQELKAQVEEEFTGHQLLLSQRPAPISDHTRGLAFDAAISLPPGARLHRRGLNLDLLAILTGFRRPDVIHDPLHFTFFCLGPRG